MPETPEKFGSTIIKLPKEVVVSISGDGQVFLSMSDSYFPQFIKLIAEVLPLIFRQKAKLLQVVALIESRQQRNEQGKSPDQEQVTVRLLRITSVSLSRPHFLTIEHCHACDFLNHLATQLPLIPSEREKIRQVAEELTQVERNILVKIILEPIVVPPKNPH